jgi:Clp amino terminal domain, pathogenicity island component
MDRSQRPPLHHRTHQLPRLTTPVLRDRHVMQVPIMSSGSDDVTDLPDRTGPDRTARVGELPIIDAVRSALKETLGAALRRGHNYIGTEHLLLGILAEDSDTATQLNSLGVTKAFVQQELAVQFARSGRARPAGSRAGELRPGNNGACPARSLGGEGGTAIDTVAAGPVYRPALAISLAARIRSASRNGIAAKLDPNLAEMPCGTHCGSAVNAAREFR